MLAALNGDGGAYRLLLSALTAHLKNYFARRLDAAAAEDAVQETLIAIHGKRATYDPAQPFTAWVYGIARYKLVDEYRRSKRRATVPLDEAAILFVGGDAEAAMTRRDLEKLLDKLTPAKRALVSAVKLDGDSIADIAARTGLSESAVKVNVHRAIKSLSDDVVEADEHR